MGDLRSPHQLHPPYLNYWVILLVMSQTTLIQKIKDDAAAAVEVIKTAGATKVEAIQRATSDMVAAKKEAHKVALAKKLAHLELVSIAKANQASKIAVQKAKREEIDALFLATMNELAALPAAEYVALFTKLAGTIVPKGVPVIAVVAPLTREAETKEILQALGVSADVTTDRQLQAGFIIYAADGVYDVTLARIVNEKRAELEMEVIQKITA